MWLANLLDISPLWRAVIVLDGRTKVEVATEYVQLYRRIQ